MTNAELLAKIKAEIERLKSAVDKTIKDLGMFKPSPYIRGELNAYEEILDFLSSLESEKQMNQEGLEEEINRLWESFADEMEGPHNLFDVYARLARHFAEWGAERLADARKTSPKDLEEAKEAYCEEHNDECFDACGSKCPHIRNAYIAGAKWQKEEDDKELSDLLTIAHLQGAEQMKEMMMKEAVEGEVCIPNVWVEHKEGKELVVRAEISKELGFKFGDKVRIIIIKED